MDFRFSEEDEQFRQEHAFDNGSLVRWYYAAAVRSIITAGTSEIMRNIIALQLGLPRG